VQAIVAAYIDAVQGSGGIVTDSQRKAIGANAKRLIKEGIPCPVLAAAATRAGWRRVRTLDPFLGEITNSWATKGSERQAMFDRWEQTTRAIKARESELGRELTLLELMGEDGS
jgi:hypothetical protein